MAPSSARPAGDSTVTRHAVAASRIIVRMPAEIDLINAADVAAELARAVDSGARIVIADLSATVFCDCSAIGVLLSAAGTAAASGAELLLVVGAGGRVRRLVDVLRLGQVLSIYPTLSAALSGRG
jgi:anti-anti-sigma factor